MMHLFPECILPVWHSLVWVWEECGIGSSSAFHVTLWQWRKYPTAKQWCLHERYEPCHMGLEL